MLICWGQVLTLQLGCRPGSEPSGLCQLSPVLPTCPPRPGTLCLSHAMRSMDMRDYWPCPWDLIPAVGTSPDLWTPRPRCVLPGVQGRSPSQPGLLSRKGLYIIQTVQRGKYQAKPKDLRLYASPQLSAPEAANVYHSWASFGIYPCAWPWSCTFFTQIVTPYT